MLFYLRCLLLIAQTCVSCLRCKCAARSIHVRLDERVGMATSPCWLKPIAERNSYSRRLVVVCHGPSADLSFVLVFVLRVRAWRISVVDL